MRASVLFLLVGVASCTTIDIREADFAPLTLRAAQGATARVRVTGQWTSRDSAGQMIGEYGGPYYVHVAVFGMPKGRVLREIKIRAVDPETGDSTVWMIDTLILQSDTGGIGGASVTSPLRHARHWLSVILSSHENGAEHLELLQGELVPENRRRRSLLFWEQMMGV